MYASLWLIAVLFLAAKWSDGASVPISGGFTPSTTIPTTPIVTDGPSVLRKTGSPSGDNKMTAPLLVAQCRASCLQKFAPNPPPASPAPILPLASPPQVLEQETATSLPRRKGKLNDAEVHGLLPNLLRLKRIRRQDSPTNSPFSCTGSDECLSCWKSCQLLEMTPEAVSSSSTVEESKHGVLACSANTQTTCFGGCQVACSFYEALLAENGAAIRYSAEEEKVVTTRHEAVVQLLEGKITWPLTESGAWVYVVIQQYPDRKWKQIAQTSELEVSIPTALTAAMKAKLRGIRVLVVGPQGLRHVFSPVVAVEEEGEEEEGSTSFLAEEITITTEGNENGDVTTLVPLVEETTGSLPSIPPPLALELRLVSLIHQKSLVIAELGWDALGGNPNQEYLITWELTGGGLKGHLVTDSTSVTLSLWPDTTYQIQVAQFTQNLDVDGEVVEEQPPAAEAEAATAQEESLAVKSLPLIVDTSVASFPLHAPSALLLSNGEEDEADSYPNDQEDEFTAVEEDEEEEMEMEDGDYSLDHKSIGQVLCVAFASVVLVLLLFGLVAFAWIKLRALSSRHTKGEEEESSLSENGESGNCFCCFSPIFGAGAATEKEDCPLVSSSQESVAAPSPIYSSPLLLNCVLSQRDSQVQKNCRSLSSLPAITPPVFQQQHHHFNCYSNNAFLDSAVDLPFSSSSSSS